MCAAMETASGVTTRQQYEAWFDEWVAPKYTGAGGLVGDLDGEAKYLYGGRVIAANPRIFAQMVKLLSPYGRALAPLPEAES